MMGKIMNKGKGKGTGKGKGQGTCKGKTTHMHKIE